MNFEEAINVIYKIESQIPINELTYKDFQVWPLIRLLIWKEVIDYDPPKKRSRIHKQIVQYGSHIIQNSTRSRAKLAQPTDLVFISQPATNDTFLAGYYYDRILDPLIELGSENYTTVKIERFQAQRNSYRPRHIPPSYFPFLPKRIVSGLSYYLKTQANPDDEINGISEILSQIHTYIGDATPNPNLITAYARDIDITAHAFEKIFRRLNPKAALISVYYRPFAFAAILACYRLGIKSIDVQHGKQGKFHGMYDLWSAIPAAGYVLLPDYFWTWGQESVENMRRPQPHKPEHHIPIVGGNRWLGQWIDGVLSYVPSQTSQSFYDRLEDAGKTILLGLQPLQDPIQPHVLQAMNEAPSDWLWMVRLHPNQIHNIESVQAILEDAQIKNYELEFSSSEPLYSLLKKADHHITAWSTICYEALVFDIPTTISHPMGAGLYSEYIEQGIFTYATTSAQLLEFIMDASRYHNHQAVEEPYMVYSKEQALQALNTIIGKQS